LQRQSPESPAPSARIAERIGRWSLRRKIMLAFTCLVVLVGICGSVSVVFFERIAASASRQTGVSSPLLIETIALQRNADRMRAIAAESSVPGESGAQHSALNTLGEEGRRHAAALKKLSRNSEQLAQIEAAERLHQNFAVGLSEILDVRARKAKASADLLESYTRLTAALLRAEADLQDVLQRRGDVFAADARARHVHELMHRITAGYQLAAKTIVPASALELDQIRAAADRIIADISAEAAKLIAASGDAASIDASLAALKAAFSAADGLFARKGELLNLTEAFNARFKALGDIERRYADALTALALTARSQNEHAASRTQAAVAQARVAILVLICFAGLLALPVASFLLLTVSRPLERLTGHVQYVRDQGDPVPFSDPALLSAPDEFGKLSRAFNTMIGELAATRQELIANSEDVITKQAERLQAAVSNMSQGLCMFDGDQRLIISNERYAVIYGIPADRIRPGMYLREILELRVKSRSHYGDPVCYVQRRVNANRDDYSGDTVVELENGRIVQILRRPLKNGGWVSTHEDITERRQIEAKIAHMAHHDVLTNLPNRILFNEKMEESLARAGRGERMAVLCLDLDHFKNVNDSLGHSLGDSLLRAVTQRLLDCIGEADTIARLGGDEFSIIQARIETPQEASTLAQRIIDRLAAPFMLDAHQVVIGASVGIALAPIDGVKPEELLKKADLALYRAKADGRGTYRFFQPEMDANMQARRKLELELRNALAAGEFELFYQPLVNLASGRISGFEALLRWRPRGGGFISPAEFIPLAEEIGLIVPIGEWVLHQACHQAANWPANVHVAVNLSPVQFKSRKLVETITLALTNSGLAPERLELEITESVLLHNNEATLAMLRQIKQFGVKISMDDFGTGYSSLSYLRSFPFDKIKIDRSFIRDLASSDDCVAIVRAVTSLGASLGMATIAEGVETTEQLERLRREGCDEVQGYLLGRPTSVADMAPLLEDLRCSVAA
jgi:diguanylate cyclase (GGDEF)-like protein